MFFKMRVLFLLLVFSPAMVLAASLDFALYVRLDEAHADIQCILNDANNWRYSSEDLDVVAQLVEQDDDCVLITLKIFGKDEQYNSVVIMEPVFKARWGKEVIQGMCETRPDGTFYGLKLSATPLK